MSSSQAPDSASSASHDAHQIPEKEPFTLATLITGAQMLFVAFGALVLVP